MMRIVYSLFLVVILISCSEDNSEIGVIFLDNGTVEMMYIDTLTVRASTVLFDSTVLNSPTRLIVGHHLDDELGELTASTFFQVFPPISGKLEGTIRYSRMTLELYADGYSYYDTSVYTTFSVYRVAEELKKTDLYSTSSFAYNPQPLGSVTFLPKPNRSDTILEIPLSDELGNEIFEMIQASNTTIAEETFLKFFNGLAVVPNANDNGPVLGFSTSPRVKIYYTDRSTIPVSEGYFEFSTSGGVQFNRIKSNRTPTALARLSIDAPALPSSETNALTYIQNGTGLRMRVQIPYLKDILLRNSNIIVMSAILQMKPVKGSFVKNANLPLSMQGIGYNAKSNVYFEAVTTAAYLMEDIDLGRNTQYRADVLSFVQQQLMPGYAGDNALVFNLSDDTYRSSVDRVYVDASPGDLKLLLQYVVVNE